MKSIKKSLSYIVAFLISLLLLCNGTIPKAQVKAEEKVTINVFSSEDYIDEEILSDFEEETGISVVYSTFSTNEEMYNELKKDPDSCDLLCVSDYMVMKLVEEDMVRSFETPDNFKEYGSDYIKKVLNELTVESANGEVNVMAEDGESTYAVGYMWGTMGMVYRIDSLTDEEIGLLSSWNSIWKNFSNKVTIKDSIRDTYLMALAEVYYDELMALRDTYENSSKLEVDQEAYNNGVWEIFNRTDVDTVNKVGDSLLRLKNNIYGFEVDAGKGDILTGKINVNVAWSGDAVYSIEQGLYDEDGNDREDPIYLGFAIPDEGTNVWIDAYAMPKNADYESALAFLDYLSRPDIAVINMDYTGYTSCIAGDEVYDYVLECYEGEEGVEMDLSYFFDPELSSGNDYTLTVDESLIHMFNAQYPTEEVILRAAVMKNFSGEELERINEMWKQMKLITLSNVAIVLIIVGIVLVIIALALYKYKNYIFYRKKKQ